MKNNRELHEKTGLVNSMLLARRLAIAENRNPEHWDVRPEDMIEILQSDRYTRSLYLAENLSDNNQPDRLFGIPIHEKIRPASSLICSDGTEYAIYGRFILTEPEPSI